jgi:hypothetical protein
MIPQETKSRHIVLPTIVFITVQTTLAYDIQRNIYKHLYLYTALEWNPLGNDETSRPYEIAKRWCHVYQGHGSDTEIEMWENHLARLGTVASDLATPIGANPPSITNTQFEQAQKKIAAATVADAKPILLKIPHSVAFSRLKPGDKYKGVEYIIENLKPEHKFEVVELNCDNITSERMP